MRIFVGTLHTIENEFEECVASIQRQTYTNFQHFIFEHLSNKEAHDTLYATFMRRATEFDLLIKVDADMVIEDRELFAKIVYKFSKNDHLKELDIPVYDWFSDQLVSGMRTYRNSVKWQRNSENLFLDLSPLPSHERMYNVIELAPAAIHCKNPSPFQAFHFGIHKGLKILQPKQEIRRKLHTGYHWNNIQRTWQNFLRTRDVRRGFAVLAAELVFKKVFEIKHLDYSDPYPLLIFEKIEDYDREKILAEIKRLRFSNWGFLPSNWRRRALFYLTDREILKKNTLAAFLRRIFSIQKHSQWFEKK
jgi:hypothetical protein